MKIERVTQGRVGPMLKAYRLDRELSQSDLEELTGVPKPRISRYENGHVTPTIDTLAALCLGLQVRPSHLLEDAGL